MWLRTIKYQQFRAKNKKNLKLIILDFHWHNDVITVFIGTSSINTGETESFKFIFKFLSSTSEAISIKYFELKLIFKFSELNSALIFSLPSPELALFTES